MSKKHLDKIEKTQREKGQEICNQIFELEDYTKHTEILSHLIGNDIANIINSPKTSKVVLNGPLFEIIPNFLPFYNVIFLTICPGCKIVYEPSKLLPYLETALVVPVLTSSLSYYPIEFINLISSFQHIPYAYYNAMAWINLFVHEENNIGEHVCDHCFYGAYEEVVAGLDKIRIAKKTKESIIDYILPKLLNPSVLNTGLLRSFSESIKSEGRKSVPQYSSILTGAGKLNESIIFSSVTSVDLRTYDLIGQVNTDLYTNSIGYIPVELVSETASRLGIAYSPKIPIKEYYHGN